MRRRILETIRVFLPKSRATLNIFAQSETSRNGSEWSSTLPSRSFQDLSLTRCHRDIVKSCSVSILRFNFTPCFDVNANTFRKKYIYIYVYEKSKWIYSVYGSNIHTQSSIFRDISRVNVSELRGSRLRLDFEIRNVFVMSRHGSRKQGARETIT